MLRMTSSHFVGVRPARAKICGLQDPPTEHGVEGRQESKLHQVRRAVHYPSPIPATMPFQLSHLHAIPTVSSPCHSNCLISMPFQLSHLHAIPTVSSPCHSNCLVSMPFHPSQPLCHSNCLISMPFHTSQPPSHSSHTPYTLY